MTAPHLPQDIPYSAIALCIPPAPKPDNCHLNACKLVCAARGVFVNKNNTALYLDGRLKFDPFLPEGVTWLKKARTVRLI
jgi:hypothetical protein